MSLVYDLACTLDEEVKVSERLWRISFVAELPVDSNVSTLANEEIKEESKAGVEVVTV